MRGGGPSGQRIRKSDHFKMPDTYAIANGQHETTGRFAFYDRRRPLGEIIVSLDDVLDTEIFDPARAALAYQDSTRARIALDRCPLPHPDDRESYFGERHLEYWLSGLQDHETLIKHCPVNSDAKRYLDFGGCSGRVGRHFMIDDLWESWVCDININYTDWMARYLPRINAFQNQPHAHLPFSDGYFDLVSAFSVFTHIDQGELAWLLELRRIVKPGGWLFITIADEYCWRLAREQDWLVDSIGNGGNAEALHQHLQGDIPADRFILRYHDETVYNANVFFRREYVRKAWGRFFKSVGFLPGVHAHQTGVVLAV